METLMKKYNELFLQMEEIRGQIESELPRGYEKQQKILEKFEELSCVGEKYITRCECCGPEETYFIIGMEEE